MTDAINLQGALHNSWEIRAIGIDDFNNGYSLMFQLYQIQQKDEEPVVTSINFEYSLDALGSIQNVTYLAS